jgi:hypothetical protein
MQIKKILVAGLVAGLAIFILSMAFSSLAQWIWDFDMMEIAGMRESDDPVMALFFVHPWVLGFAMAILYTYCGKALEGDFLSKGACFGFLMWIVVGIPSAFLVFTSMDYPVGFTVNSVIGTLIYLLVSGILISKLFEWMK